MSRNNEGYVLKFKDNVTPRKGRVSRNKRLNGNSEISNVTPRKGRVSRNFFLFKNFNLFFGHASQGACE